MVRGYSSSVQTDSSVPGGTSSHEDRRLVTARAPTRPVLSRSHFKWRCLHDLNLNTYDGAASNQSTNNMLSASSDRNTRLACYLHIAPVCRVLPGKRLFDRHLEACENFWTLFIRSVISVRSSFCRAFPRVDSSSCESVASRTWSIRVYGSQVIAAAFACSWASRVSLCGEFI